MPGEAGVGPEAGLQALLPRSCQREKLMTLKLTAAYKTDVGKQREQNEDKPYTFISEEGESGLFIVADGMGGYQAGEVASKLAVEKISDALKSFFLPLSEQPTVQLTPLSEQQTVKLQSMQPGEQTTPGSSQKTRYPAGQQSHRQLR
jgi:protein phosphatase